MPKELAGKLDARGKRFAIVASRYNDFIASKLIEGATDCLIRHNCAENDISLVRVPGAFEIPLVARKLAASGKYNGVICLGAVIRGATPHFDYIASETSKGISRASLDTGVPVIFGVLTTDTIEQALERAGSKAGNKGWEAALSAIEMADLLAALGE